MSAIQSSILPDGREILIGQLEPADLPFLHSYLNSLSHLTRQRFAPHDFDYNAIANIHKAGSPFLGFIARERGSETVIAYAILKVGLLEHDLPRLQQYIAGKGTLLNFNYAPSVADSWQGTGTGTAVLNYIIQVLNPQTGYRLILWGGVQAGNHSAIRFYRKNGFIVLGQFSFNGPNLDMVLPVTG